MVRYAGKRLTAKKVAAIVDSIPHKIYVEPFAGMATVMKHKRPSEKEIVSDLDCKVIRVAKRENPTLKRATVMCGKDYKKIVQRYDSKDTLFYLDPPYEGIKSNWEQMKYDTNKVKLDDVLSVCKNVKGKCILSYHPKFKRKICSEKKLSCKTIPFNFWGHKRYDLVAIKR